MSSSPSLKRSREPDSQDPEQGRINKKKIENFIIPLTCLKIYKFIANDYESVFNLMTLEEDISLKLEKESDGVVLQLLRTELAQVRTDIDRAIACTTTTSAPQSPSRRLGRERRPLSEQLPAPTGPLHSRRRRPPDPQFARPGWRRFQQSGHSG